MDLIRRFCLAFGFACALACAGNASAKAEAGDEKTIRLTSLDWPPYSGAELKQRGATTAVVRAALAAMGYKLEVKFFPWSRAVALVNQPSDFIGYFPEYTSPKIADKFLLSSPIGSGPLGFAQIRKHPVQWKTLDDLQAYRIGVVQDYVNADEFDRRIADGRQMVDVARNDTQNLLKLASGRIPLAVIDQRVFEFLSRHDPAIAKIRHKLDFHLNLLEEKKLFICFRRSAEGERVRDIVNAGLKRIDVKRVMAEALK
ncbi:substrate-binding periplasmic protein [Massilia glaciei]|uniref:ABC transporter n=1 Tax=Massilia glaciei TaxID=1524097 RepID=A0A2U2I4M5_9BURK|nr:ABC transporter substrate-binding protein [Massilia glaciei]PWF54701.1 ABC transporter [Massilia glaciei]